MIRSIFRFVKKISKVRLAILAVIIIVILYGILNTVFKPSDLEIKTSEVKTGDIKSVISASGTINGKDSATIKFKTSGKLVFQNFKAGDQVFQGQVLAGQDTQDLSITLQQTLNTLREKQTTVDKVLDDIHLFQYGNGGFGNVGSPDETMTQRQLRTTAEVLRDNAYDSVKLTQRAFQDSVITSPINGIITKSDFFNGQFISPADTIYQITDWGEIYFDAEVDEADITKIKLGQSAEVELNSYPDQKFAGEVTEIKPQAKTTSSGATIVIVRIRLNDLSISNISGLNGQVNIIEKEVKNIVSIPQQSLNDNQMVFIKTLDGFKEVKVKTGLSSDADIEIIAGLKVGDQVVLNPSLINPSSGNILTRLLRR